LLRVADAHYNEKRFQDGLIAYQKVGILYPKAPEVADARYGVVLSYYQLRQYPQFLREAQLFVQQHGQHPLSGSLLQQMAEHYQEQKQPNEAIETYNTLVQKYPQSPLLDKALLRLGELYAGIGQHQQAIQAYERLLRQGKAADLKPEALWRQGQAYEALGDTQAALRRYEQLASQSATRAVAARGLLAAGRLLLAQKDYAAALRYFDTIIRQYPQEPLRYESLLQSGISHLHQQQPDRAITVLQQAAQAPEARLAANAQLQLGHAYSLAGDLQQGVNAYLRVAYLYPEERTASAQALHAAARNYVKLQRCADAVTVYTKLLQLTTEAQEAQDIQQEMARSGCREATPGAR
jgi:tetratricopeptide (TPR) repeat protein